MSKTEDAAVAMAHARDLFPAVPWTGNGGGFISTLEFTHLLGTDWLSDDLVDSMITHLAHRARAQFHERRILIESSQLAEAIKGVALSGKNMLCQCQVRIDMRRPNFDNFMLPELYYDLLASPAYKQTRFRKKKKMEPRSESGQNLSSWANPGRDPDKIGQNLSGQDWASSNLGSKGIIRGPPNLRPVQGISSNTEPDR
ncbi:hypothetical protein DFH29DRAFT_1050655 [Suillus ampliporus]|nr:hypothetical protein DFH29DRAFT_1050655 [Suillus ampliporus]